MLNRPFEIVFGSVLVLLGIIMLVVPGPGVPVIIAGITFISPYHGRRVLWWAMQAWKWLKQEWHARWYGRKSKSVRALLQLKWQRVRQRFVRHKNNSGRK